VIVVIGDGALPTQTDEQPPGEPAQPPQAVLPGSDPGKSRPQVRATPLVRRLAQELGVDLENLAGTGPQGRITEEDVRRADSATEAPSPAEGRREPLRGVRRLIAESMTRAQEIPAVTWVEECDFGAIDLARLVPVVLQATARSLQEFPELNARLEADEIVYLDRYDLGFAVQTEQGLVVPVVRGCDSAGLDELEAEVGRLAEAAREGRLKPEELRGATFTVTSAGKLGGLLVTPMIHAPEVAILGIHRIAERPVVRDGEVVVRRIGHVSVTFDHRVVDGARAAEFGLSVIRRLEAAWTGESPGRAPGSRR
jgi:pyruvate dehydrogenase E2 component (dihydrolipoamide acetyltransferase)